MNNENQTESNMGEKKDLQDEHEAILQDEDSDSLLSDESDEVSDEQQELSNPRVLMRESNPELPETVSVLETPDGGRVYLVGTAHFSENSQEDVAKVIKATQPDVVMVELCSSRVNILRMDEETLLKEAKDINMEKIKAAIQQSGVLQGIMHLLLLSMSAHLTKELGMAPGGEFRRAFKEAQHVPGCRVHLGDRPINITLRRALGALSLWQKVKLAWYMLTSKDPISKEEVEKCKNKDMLEEMLKEMTGEFPLLSKVFVTERDMFLTHSLRAAAHPLISTENESGYIPAVVVGVVGIGHAPGIKEHWNSHIDLHSLLSVPETTLLNKMCIWTVKASILGALAYGSYKMGKWTYFTVVPSLGF